MKNFKRIIASVLTVLMVLTVAGCHKKDEIAVTVGDVEFTSAYYMCALINADSEAKTKINESLSEEDQSSSGSIDYYSKKIDKKDYVEWVEDRAIENLKTIAAYKTLCKENKIELTEEDINNAETYASYYWSTYGYSNYFEPNGVGQSTYSEYMKDTYYSENYFKHLYGEGGEKAIAADEVKTKMYDNFVLANVLTGSYTSEMTDAEKTALKNKFNGYIQDLQNGTKNFEAIYKEYNNITDDTTKSTTEESDELKPQDEYATVVGAEGTAYERSYFSTVKEMANGQTKVIELEDKSGIILVVKKEISEDEYYLKELDMVSRHLIKDEEFENTVNDYAKKLKADINKYAVGQFKVKKIIEPSYS